MLRLCLVIFFGLLTVGKVLGSFSYDEGFLAFLPEACEGITVPSFDALGVKGWELKSQKAQWKKDRTLWMQAMELTYASGAESIYLDATEAVLSEPLLIKMKDARATTQGLSLEGSSWVLHDQTLEVRGNARAVFLGEQPSLGDFLGLIN